LNQLFSTMRKICTLFLTLAYCAFSAQPFITESHVPLAGMNWTETSFDNPTGIELGSSGAGQAWDFSGVIGESNTSLLQFVLPSDLPSEFSGLFPDADLAIHIEEDTVAQFFAIESDGFYIDGLASSSGEPEPESFMIDFDPDNLLFPLDFGYEDVREHESRNVLQVDFGVEYEIRTYEFSTYTGDAYGSLTTPAGSYSSVLRIQVETLSFDSTFADTDMDGELEFISASEVGESDFNYFFLQEGTPVMLATMEMNEDQSAIEYFSYIQDNATGLPEGSAESLVLYPNPSTGPVSIKDGFDSAMELRVYDTHGRLIDSATLQAGEREIDMSELNSGNYVIEFRNKGSITTRRISIK
jgi:hypothetical protein